VLMQENAIYSVITPEGCAAILWRDAGEARKAAAAFKPDAVHCLELGVIDEIVKEPSGGAHLNPDEAARLLGEALERSLGELQSVSGEQLRDRRRDRYRRVGIYTARAVEPVLQPGS
jgi:acetyl-CoA carboxylase carboxyl transferase subunit alpha